MAMAESDASGSSVDQTPLVTIVTPSYNQASFLDETIRSVVSQDYGRVEYLVMDGGSDDGSVDIIREWADKHPIRWQSERDAGQADAIVHGFGSASGEIVGWLNSDDVYLDDRVISDVVAEFRKGAQVVTGAGWYISESGERLRHIPVLPDRISHEALRAVDWILQPATFFRRDMFLELGLDTNLHYAFDWDFFIRLSRLVRFTPLARDMAGYRIHETGKTVSGGIPRLREIAEVTRRYHGGWSARYMVVRAMLLFYRLNAWLPDWFSRKGIHLLDSFARFTSRVTNGRGLQY